MSGSAAVGLGAALGLTLGLALALAPIPASAVESGPAEPLPEPRAWSLSVGTGGGGFVEFVDAFSNAGPGGYDRSRRSSRLQLNVRLDRALNRWLRAELAGVHNRWTDTYFSGGGQVGTIDNAVYTVLAGGTVTWYRSQVVELSGGLTIGAGTWRQSGQGIGASQTGRQSGLAFQLRYFGINLGDERFRAFADLGIGFEGLVVAGLMVRL